MLKCNSMKGCYVISKLIVAALFTILAQIYFNCRSWFGLLFGEKKKKQNLEYQNRTKFSPTKKIISFVD